ncbi:cytochrome c oxidase subunit I [Coraliomargarita sp. SDUM461004]|uniref:Cytochrome c oxidase subunit 1 n=1 Tax=Thalassobacterium sedimentorum TaxID=3041258 RepID=A0ABU1AKI6_9BACT|nr:cytochrome c oxidase subunit I [Coraliomargarita sp. SDUM461004]MDQ8194256.1 cytochrome c oxidase subunit I [Coraliomargarita sp. SDUM461004]
MSQTQIETPSPTTTQAQPAHVLKPERSRLGLMRPDHSKSVFIDWLTTVDHKKIGIMYGAIALFFLFIGGLEALIIRTQLIIPENDLITAQRYNQLFTMHGTTMIFLAVMPLNSAFFNYLIPLQIGARDVAFPRINSLSLWTFVAGALVINFGWLLQALEMMGLFAASGPTAGMTDMVPAGGWFGYAPLTSKDYTGVGTDFWVMGLQILGVASLSSSMNFIVTILNMRAPGMKMMRMPVFTWMSLVVAFLIIFAFPAITIALGQLMFDRVFDTNFFNVAGGGQPILWQHLFWIFGHPEVYILVLPAMGIISEVLPAFSKKPLFGYSIVVFSGAVIGFLGFAVWSHHMFTTGLGKVATAAFSLLTMAIAVPTGVKIFNWVGTLWGGRVRFTAPMIFSLGFVWMFMMGGFSGIMHAAAPADAQQQDSYFVIAHFHYVIMGGIFLALVSGIYYWVPKVFGKMWKGTLSNWVAVLIVVGLNVTFFPMHFLGLLGMPRRTHTYLEGFGWASYNMVCTIGSYILALGILLLLVDLIRCLRSGEPAGDDPWDARTLEWATTSPPQVYNFAQTPVIPARDALWVHKHGPENKKITYEADHGHGIHMPSNSWMPLIASVGFVPLGLGMTLMQAGVPYMGYVAIFGLIMITIGLILWAIEGPGGYHLHPEQENT